MILLDMMQSCAISGLGIKFRVDEKIWEVDNKLSTPLLHKRGDLYSRMWKCETGHECAEMI